VTIRKRFSDKMSFLVVINCAVATSHRSPNDCTFTVPGESVLWRPYLHCSRWECSDDRTFQVSVLTTVPSLFQVRVFWRPYLHCSRWECS